MRQKDFAQNTARSARGAGFSIDPISILTVITQVITLLKNCGLTPAQAAKRVQNPGLLDRLRIRDEARKAGLRGKQLDSCVAAVIDEARGLSTADLKQMYEEGS